VPGWKGPVPWIFNYASITYWISVLGDSTLRFPVCSAEYHLLGGSRELVLFQGLINTPPWHLAANGREEYYLGATFRGLEESKVPSLFIWGSSLSIPPVCLPTEPIPAVWPGNGRPSVNTPAK
jgi:pimeloyl-ACP methyl ester carboxylesterase